MPALPPVIRTVLPAMKSLIDHPPLTEGRVAPAGYRLSQRTTNVSADSYGTEPVPVERIDPFAVQVLVLVPVIADGQDEAVSAWRSPQRRPWAMRMGPAAIISGMRLWLSVFGEVLTDLDQLRRSSLSGRRRQAGRGRVDPCRADRTPRLSEHAHRAVEQRRERRRLIAQGPCDLRSLEAAQRGGDHGAGAGIGSVVRVGPKATCHLRP